MKIIFKTIYRYSPFLNVLVSLGVVVYCFLTLDLTGLNDIAISWYGRFSDTALVFNGGLIISGILNLMFAHRIYNASKALKYANADLIGVILFVASLGSFGIALIPVPWYREELLLRFLHSYCAFTSIFLWPVGSMLLAVRSGSLWLRNVVFTTVFAMVLGSIVVILAGGGFWELEFLLFGALPVLVGAMWWWVEGAGVESK